MTTNTLSVEDITSDFTTNPLLPIIGEPTYEALQAIVKRLCGNAVSAKTPNGGGPHAHLGMLMSPQLYAIISATHWTEPEDQGITLAFEVGQFYDGPTKQAITNTFKERKRLYHTYPNMDTALKKNK